MKKLQRHEPCLHCGRYDNRGVTVGGILIRDNTILLIRRGIEPFQGWWALPGGYVEWGETTEEAMIREMREETGLVVIDCKLIGVFSQPSRHPEQVINATYRVTVDSGQPRAGDDAEMIQWWPLTALPKELAFDHMEIIRVAQRISSEFR